jgi:hypothetical protein
MTTLTLSPILNLRQIVARIGDGLMRLADQGPLASEVRRLSAMTDADLARAGTTRRAEVERIFGARMYL